MKLYKKLFIFILLLGFSMACKLVTPSGDGTVSLSNCYQVSFLEYSQITDQVSSWRYQVKELSCAQDLSNWAFELPACANVIDASPSPWEIVQPDPNYHFDGIKWQTSTDFQSGEFTVVLLGALTTGEVQVGVKGPDVAIDTITGPICETETTITPTVTSTPDMETSTPTQPTEEETPTPTEAAPTETPLPTVQPPSPPPSSGPIIITDNGQTLTFTCSGNAVEVRGNANVITLLGSCTSITVKGNANQVYWQSGLPVITNTGNENIISQK